jgi:hypothetical protein
LDSVSIVRTNLFSSLASLKSTFANSSAVLKLSPPDIMPSLVFVHYIIVFRKGENLWVKFRLDGGVLIALAGVWYHASENIRCDRCLHMTKGGVTTYYHSALAGGIVKPGSASVMLVMLGNGDGEKKQDCELADRKRWVTKYGEAYRWLKPAILGDDLYSHEPFCRQVQEAGIVLYSRAKRRRTRGWRKRYPGVRERS